MIHIPVDMMLRWLMKLSRNRTYLYVGRILMLSLVTLLAIGCAGDWVMPVELNSFPCQLGFYECYYGAPLGLLDFIYKFGAPQAMLLIPIIALLSAILLLFMPSRTYLIVNVINFGAFIIIAFFSDPSVIINYYFGSGQHLTEIAIVSIVIFCLPLSVAEHAKYLEQRNSRIRYLEN